MTMDKPTPEEIQMAIAWAKDEQQYFYDPVASEPDRIRARVILALADQLSAAREALTAVLRDIEDYERANNLAPNPGRKYCWDSVANAHAFLTPSESRR